MEERDRLPPTEIIIQPNFKSKQQKEAVRDETVRGPNKGEGEIERYQCKEEQGQEEDLDDSVTK